MENPDTYFARPERGSPETVAREHAVVSSDAAVPAMLDGFPEPAAIINRQRQIVLANDKLARLTTSDPKELLGRRIGQAVDCVHGDEPPNGCGTTPACALCGAASAIARTEATRQAAVEECRIRVKGRFGYDALDVRVWTTPIEVQGEPFTVFAVRDTSDEQRRRVLERMFFHDVLNSAGGLHNLLRLLPRLSVEQAAPLAESATHLAAQVVEEIQAQRDLSAAERGDLVVREQETPIGPLLENLVALYQNHTVAEAKRIALEAASEPAQLVTDPLLLRRVLGNLLKNALEASDHGDVVTLRFSHPGRPVFEIHNVTIMSTAVKMQIFQRSFSTKPGSGRGVGTYSARLLTERFLGGELSFESEPGRGTTFTVRLRRGGQ